MMQPFFYFLRRSNLQSFKENLNLRGRKIPTLVDVRLNERLADDPEREVTSRGTIHRDRDFKSRISVELAKKEAMPRTDVRRKTHPQKTRTPNGAET
jgi:hypothetical protein